LRTNNNSTTPLGRVLVRQELYGIQSCIAPPAHILSTAEHLPWQQLIANQLPLQPSAKAARRRIVRQLRPARVESGSRWQQAARSRSQRLEKSGELEIEAFLTHLATHRKVSAKGVAVYFRPSHYGTARGSPTFGQPSSVQFMGRTCRIRWALRFSMSYV